MAFYISGDLHDSYEAALLGDNKPAIGLWATFGVWCSRNITGGFVPAGALKLVSPRCNIMRGDKDPDAYRQRLRKQGGL